MKTALDLFLILVSTMCLIQSGERILRGKSKTLCDYIIVIVYFFNVLPVLLDYILGRPNYLMLSWYSNFERAATNDTISLLYNLYMVLTMVSLQLYLMQKNRRRYTIQIYNDSNSIFFYGSTLLFISLIPIVYALVSTDIASLLIFQPASRRGTANVGLLMFFELMGIFSFFCWFFRNTKRPHSYMLLLVYCTVICWIDGKRYLIVVLAMMFIFFYNNSSYSQRKKIPLKMLLLVSGMAFAAFYVTYALTYKVGANGLRGSVFDWMYLSFRIDFGRDDVTKFVLLREAIDRNPILEYRFETVLSTIFVLVPRAVWPSKPYPHYRYLTAALYGTTVLEIPAGMTPSIFEMGIANFGVILGMPLTILILIILINLGDRAKTVPHKVLYLILIETLLTQSPDAILFVLLVLFYITVTRRVRFKIGPYIIGGNRHERDY